MFSTEVQGAYSTKGNSNVSPLTQNRAKSSYSNKNYQSLPNQGMGDISDRKIKYVSLIDAKPIDPYISLVALRDFGKREHNMQQQPDNRL